MIATTRTLPSSPGTRIATAMIICGVLTAGASVARAEDSPVNAPRVLVNYGDLDLNSEKGALALYRRITTAARQVCPSERALSVRAAVIARQCVAEAVSNAVRDVNSPQLARVDAARSARFKQG